MEYKIGMLENFHRKVIGVPETFYTCFCTLQFVVDHDMRAWKKKRKNNTFIRLRESNFEPTS